MTVGNQTFACTVGLLLTFLTSEAVFEHSTSHWCFLLLFNIPLNFVELYSNISFALRFLFRMRFCRHLWSSNNYIINAFVIWAAFLGWYIFILTIDKHLMCWVLQQLLRFCLVVARRTWFWREINLLYISPPFCCPSHASCLPSSLILTVQSPSRSYVSSAPIFRIINSWSEQ